MRSLYVLLIIALFSLQSFGQESDTLKENTNAPVIETEEIAPDTTTIQVGEKEVKIVEEDGETIVIVDEEMETEEDGEEEKSVLDELKEEWDFEWENDDDDKAHESSKFKGHWAGFEFGLNNYVNSDNSIDRTAETEFLDLNTAKSWNFNFNFAQYSFPVLGKRFGLVTGMGLEWNNYHFSNSNTIYKDTDAGQIAQLDLTGSVKKNRLQTMYLTVPMIVELQVGKGSRSDRVHLAGGVVAGLKMYSNTKYKVSENGGNRTEKDKSDYYLQPFRYGVTARAGYKLVKVYMNYYLTPLFLDNRGPELYPVSMGIALTF